MYGLPNKIYLASKSPRRRELLKQIGVQFELVLLREGSGRTQDVNEGPLPGELPRAYVERVCALKAEIGWTCVLQRRLPRVPLLAADTTVAVDDVILGKPAGAADALATLQRLSGREHDVFTAVTARFDERSVSALSASRVRFATLSEAEMRAYVASHEGMDKAGGYAIQGQAAAFIADLSGSYSGVMGLPLHETVRLLREIMPRP